VVLEVPAPRHRHPRDQPGRRRGRDPFAGDWIDAAIYDDVCRGQTFKTDNFGRWLIDLYRLDTGERLVDALRAAGHEKSPTQCGA